MLIFIQLVSSFAYKAAFEKTKLEAVTLCISYVYTRLPVKTLQLEQLAVVGSSEEPSVVASRMRLVFSTLEVSFKVQFLIMFL